MWGKPLDGDRYIRTRDIVHALGNSDQYPFSLGQRPKTPEEEFGHKAMIETINAVVAAIEAAPQYVWQDGRLTRETDEEGNARRQEAVGLRLSSDKNFKFVSTTCTPFETAAFASSGMRMFGAMHAPAARRTVFLRKFLRFIYGIPAFQFFVTMKPQEVKP